MFPATGSTITAAISLPRARPAPLRCDRRLHDHRSCCAEGQRPPRADEIEIAPAVDVPESGAFTTGDEERLAADPAKRAHRTVHAPGNDPLRAEEEPRGLGG